MGSVARLVRVARPRALACVTTLAGLAAGQRAEAQRTPSLVTDGVYVGARANPGFAPAAAWDLDVYLLRSRALSVGASVAASALGGGAEPGRAQELLVASEAVRVKLGPFVAPAWRPWLSLGAGVGYARLPAQDGPTLLVVPEGGGAPVRGAQRFEALREFFPLVTLGAGVDWYVFGPAALSSQLLVRARAGGPERVPEVWGELYLGVRFGL